MKEYQILDTLVLRTPTNTLNELEKLSNLNLLMKDASFLEALYISTPALYNDIIRFDEIKDDKKKKKIIESIYKFYSRMCTRSTPYGLFATCGTLSIGEETDIKLSEKERFKKNIRLDMNFLCALAQKLEKEETIRDFLKFYPNSSIYNINNSYRYIEYKYKNSQRNHFLSGVPESEYLDKIFQLTKTNGATIIEITNCLIDDEITSEEANEFVIDLILNQLLVSDLEPIVLTGDFLGNIISIISEIPTAKLILEQLVEIENDIRIINESSIGVDLQIYELLILKIEALDVGIDRGKLFQLDFSNQTDANFISRQVLKKIEKCLSVIDLLNSINYNALSSFIEKFSERHEEVEIPLTIALDNETGVYSTAEGTEDTTSPLVDDIPTYSQSSEITELKWTKKDSYFNQLIQKALYENESIIQLDENDITKNFNKVEAKNTVSSFTAMFSLINENGIQKIELEGAGGNNSAVDLQGRFAHINEAILKNINIIAKAEQDNEPDKIFADIVHLPESRVGNILMRPALHTHQIPYLAKATCTVENIIEIDDLMVSVKNRRVVLRSKKHNKEIVPRLSNAHNYSMSSLNIYSFLCKLQTHDKKTFFGFDLGNCSSLYTYIPRIEFNNVILYLATWNLNKKILKALLEAHEQKNNEQIKIELIKLRAIYKIPAKVCLADGDNTLYFNLENEYSLQVWLEEIKNRQSFVLKEFIFNQNSNVSNNHNEQYSHQIIASFIKKTTENFNIPIIQKIQSEPQRFFTTGSNWLYYKIYCGAKIGDQFLAENIKEITDELIVNNAIKKWFFIRYSDSQGQHIRLRFELKKDNDVSQITKLIYNTTQSFIKDGLVHKVQTDTYQREIERYGKASMELSETLFYYDSKTILNFIALIEGDEGELFRWLFALKYIDSLLNSFDLDLTQKIKFTASNAAAFLQEFGGNKSTKDEVNKKYRENKELIAGFMNESNEVEDWLILFDIIKTAEEERKELCSEIKEIVLKEQEFSLEFILSSYVHMSVNRLFRSKQRKNEMVIYDFLNKFYLWQQNTRKIA